MEYVFESGFEYSPVLLILYVVYTLLMGLLGIAAFVLRSMGVYTLATRRGIKRAWFAWIPVLDQYLLGCISDQYQYVVKGKNKAKRNVLLWLNIGKLLIGMGFGGSYVWMIINVMQNLLSGPSEELMMQAVMGPAVAIMSLSIPLLVIGIVAAVFRYIALYDLYTSCSPQNNVMFLALSIIFRVTEPFFIFFTRKLDGGMPPRRETAAAEPVAEISAPEIDPWDRPDHE